MCLLHRLRANLSLFLITITLLTTIGSVFGQPTYNYHFCSNTTHNDTANIKTLLGSLSSKAAQNNSFYKNTSNDLHGLYQCRGDVATDMCQKCVEAAIQEIQKPSRCQSRSRADIWYDECVLRYAHTNFFGTVKLDPQVLMYNTGNASSPNNTYVDTLSLMRRLASEAGKEPMMYYAHEELPATAGDVAPKNVSAMVQCCEDISGDDCNRCLQNLTMHAEKCCLEKSGWRILAPSCNMRYEEYRFLTPSAPPPVPPPAPTTTIKGKVVVIITISVITFLVVAFGFYCYLLFGRRSKAREEVDMKREIERKEQEKKKNQKVEFVTGGTQHGVVAQAPKINIPVPGASTVAAGGLHPVPGAVDSVARDGRQNYKSKWDKVDGDQRSLLPPGGQDSISAAGAHAAFLSVANAGCLQCWRSYSKCRYNTEFYPWTPHVSSWTGSEPGNLKGEAGISDP